MGASLPRRRAITHAGEDPVTGTRYGPPMSEERLRRGARALAILALTSAVLLPGGASVAQRSSNPYDATVRKLEREVERYGRSARESGRAVPRMLELEGLADHASPGVVKASLTRLSQSRRLLPHLRAYATMLRGLAEQSTGDPAVAQATFDSLGYVRDWMVIGAFDNEGKSGFDRELPPEAQRNAPVDRSASYQGKERQVSWRRYPQELSPKGYISFDAIFRPWVNTCAYAETFVELEEAEPLTLWLGAAGASKVYFNGAEVHSDEAYRRVDYDRFSAAVAGRAGANRILVKVCTAEGPWGFTLRVGDRRGAPRADLTFTAEGPTAAADAPANVSVPDAPVAPLANLEALVEAAPDSRRGAGVHYDLSRFLHWTGATDEGTTRFRELAEKAAELDPSVEHLELAADFAENRAERMRFVAQAEERSARDPRVVLQRAQLLASGPDPGQALRLLLDASFRGQERIEADWMIATLYEQRDLKQAAMAIIERNLRGTGGAARWVRRHANALERLGHEQAAHEATERLLALRPDDYDAHRRMIADARIRGEHERMLAHLETMRTLDPADIGQRLYEASILEGLDRRDDALAIYRQIIEWTPEESSYHVRLGDVLVRFDQTDAAIAAFRQALALRPQDASVRERLEQLQPTDRPDENRAIEPEVFLARRSDETRYPMSVLHDLTVSTVYENGLTHRFHQYVFQVHTEEGARRARSFGIPFEPGDEWVDVRSVKTFRKDGSILDNYEAFTNSVGQAAYRVYYDVRQRVLRFPELEPGDVVEIRYRVDDVSRRNAFNDYYGNVRMLQRGVPVRSLEHVLIAPASRRLHFNDPQMRGLRHERSRTDGQQVHRFTATDIPAMRSERNMPGVTEVAPYLHVSTYATWEEVGRWWWGLSQDQLRPDEGIRETVRELTAGLTDVREKVAKIYAWVTENTRYVGLEFGIHGFKPYRITQVVDRGFGDCKDTASLLYAMFELAGIEAKIALVRTSNNGMIAESPASLAVFNHAIAYVPELDLYLDGTTDTHGMSELPAGDQGALTLLVDPESVELRVAPYLSADDVRRERTLEIQLAADGSATLSGSERVTGSRAGMYRTRYQAAATRRERLQAALAGRFAGIEVTEESFDELDPTEPVRFTYEATVPQLARRSGDELRVAPGGGRIEGLARTPTRRHPLMLGPPETYVERRVVHLPQGHTVGTLPDGGEASSPFGRVAVQYDRQGDAVTVETTVALTRPRVGAEEYPRFREWVQAADQLLRERIVIRPEGQ
jgi:tetratricopeptide (TPR) repeat protein/transglutaminase-like putative cysteine protease